MSLINDVLCVKLNVIWSLQYNKQHIIPLEEVKLQPLQDDGCKN